MATPAFAERVKETSPTTGTGTLDLAGAETGFQGFVAAGLDGEEVFYVITDESGNWEVGRGTVTDASPDTLSRTTIIDSSNSGAAVNFGAGTKTVGLVTPAYYLRPIAARYALIDDKTIADSTPDTVEFDNASTELFNVGGGITHSTGTNPDRFTVAAPLDGRMVLVSALIRWASDPDGFRQLTIYHYNSSDTELSRASILQPAVASTVTEMGVAHSFQVSTGDYFVLGVQHSAGGNLDLDAQTPGGADLCVVSFQA